MTAIKKNLTARRFARRQIDLDALAVANAESKDATDYYKKCYREARYKLTRSLGYTCRQMEGAQGRAWRLAKAYEEKWGWSEGLTVQALPASKQTVSVEQV